MSFPIVRLPDSTTQLISSHAQVVTPMLLVKELLDNAIDAKATSVEILISPDTVSKIEVRDDGVGIHPNDYDALGRRGHTSKLRSIEELGSLVGKSLGFRGEALASVNSMANVTITTKISTEPIAAALQLIPNQGGILTQKPTSAPVGTTVSVTELFGHQPVRRQVATKEAKKTLEKIQELLRSYAMARPQLRLLFKILQTPTKTWSYSPKRNATLSEAALQLFGIEVASSCLLKTLQTSYTGTDSDSAAQRISKPTRNDFVFEMLLANPDVDLQRTSKRHYFSVDGRPINAGRGIAKRLLNIYLEHLRSLKCSKDITDCFISLNMSCPPGSYDANIEPSKDNVLFSDEQVVLEAFRRLCDDIY
ncbi:histidine kinase-like ATPase, partial [Xylaria flabelliformis]